MQIVILLQAKVELASFLLPDQAQRDSFQPILFSGRYSCSHAGVLKKDRAGVQLFRIKILTPCQLESQMKWPWSKPHKHWRKTLHPMRFHSGFRYEQHALRVAAFEPQNDIRDSLPTESGFRLFLLAWLAGAFSSARHNEGADDEAGTEESKIHVARWQLQGLGLWQDRREGQRGVLRVIHAHHHQQSQDGDDQYSFEEQFEIHGASLLMQKP